MRLINNIHLELGNYPSYTAGLYHLHRNLQLPTYYKFPKRNLALELMPKGTHKGAFCCVFQKIKEREEQSMEKMILADNTEIKIQEGASLDRNVVAVEDFSDLKAIAEALTKDGNLDTVKYKSGEQVTGNYEGMKLESPLFTAVDYYADEKKVIAAFGIKEKTKLEKRVDALEGRADVTEGALQEMILAQMGGEE